MEIIILRHGKPVIPHLNKLSASEFTGWVRSYDASGLCSTSIPTNEALDQAVRCNAVVCSALPRSIESARALQIQTITLSDTQFNEAELPTANWNYLKLSPKAWAVIFRILWLLGYSNNSESYKEAKTRASKAAHTLKELAEKYNSVLFVGHGVYNRLLARELKATGWVGPRSSGSKHWNFGVYKHTGR
ncbi:MAG: histidine phosphatase family protein [Gammaproteobacteria bacterium]|nr:histidine phosphatase family protein [Gammaproteobacteria bacterium]